LSLFIFNLFFVYFFVHTNILYYHTILISLKNNEIMGMFDTLKENFGVTSTSAFWYFALVLVLLIIVFVMVGGIAFWTGGQDEGMQTSTSYMGRGLDHKDPTTSLSRASSRGEAITSGGLQRRLSQSFSQPNQGPYTTTHKDDVIDLMPEGETLVNSRGEPDFWEVGSILSQHRARRRQDLPGGSAARMPETFEGSAAQQVVDTTLTEGYLWR
jgi:hypothetical protein